MKNLYPYISIITVVKNGEKYLEETIKSVINQTYKNYEYIVIDGGSKDKTLDIIKKYSDKIDYWVSETDKGLYDAFNKGMQLAKGDFIEIINSDDVYLSKTLEILKKYINNNPNIDFIFGSVKNTGVCFMAIGQKFFTAGVFTQVILQVFLLKKIHKLVGLYNLKYKYHADYDYFFRMIVKKKLLGIYKKRGNIWNF